MSKIRAKVIRKKSVPILARYAAETRAYISRGANLVRNTAVQSIQSHGSSGRTYQKYNPRREHTASTEGNPPNTDTGFLVSNIHAVIDQDGFGASVESRADYSEALEFGTSTMGARPFLQPALEENRTKIIAMFATLRASR